MKTKGFTGQDMEDSGDNYAERILNICLGLAILMCLFVLGQNLWDHQHQRLKKITEDARAIVQPTVTKAEVPKAAKQMVDDLQHVLTAEGRRGNTYWLITCLCSVLVFLAYGQANERLEEVETHGFLVVCMIWALVGPPVLQVLNLKADQLKHLNTVTAALQQEVKSITDTGELVTKINANLATMDDATRGERFQSWRVAAMAGISAGLIVAMWWLVRKNRGEESAS